VVDTQGLLLGVVVTEANTQDQLGGVAVLIKEACDSGSLQLLWVDQGYTGEKFARAIASVCGAKVEVVKRSEAGFQVLPRRWMLAIRPTTSRGEPNHSMPMRVRVLLIVLPE
jgi:putative transposase